MTDTDDNSTFPDALLRLGRVLKIIDVSPATWWEWQQLGFGPKSIKYSPRITFWKESEVRAFAKRLLQGEKPVKQLSKPHKKKPRRQPARDAFAGEAKAPCTHGI